MTVIAIGGLIFDDSPFKSLITNYTNYLYFDINNIEPQRLEAQLINIIDQQDEVLIIAYSTGGLLLLSIYQHIQHKNIKIILLNSTPFFMEDHNWLGIKSSDYNDLEQKLNTLNINSFKRYFESLSAYPYKRMEINSYVTDKTYIAKWLSFIKHTDMRLILAHITTPLLIINSKHDIIAKYNSVNNTNYIQSKLLSNSSHSILNDNELIQIVSEFTHAK